MSKLLKIQSKKAIIFIQSTPNNTIISLTDLRGLPKFWTSAGCLGFKNSRKSTTYAAQAAAEKLANKALSLGFYSTIIKIKGLGFGKEAAIKAIYKSKLIISRIEEITPIAHNGCRSPRKRRT